MNKIVDKSGYAEGVLGEEGAKKKAMKSIIMNEKDRKCYLCGAVGGVLEWHHIFGGNPNRKKSEKYGLKVRLCPRCHRDNKAGVHSNAEAADYLHRIGQKAFERTHTRKEFCEIFGKNYLDMEDNGVK